MAEIIEFPTKGMTPAQVLEMCAKEEWTEILVIGTDKGDNHVYTASSTNYSPEIAWLLQKVLFHLLWEAKE